MAAALPSKRARSDADDDSTDADDDPEDFNYRLLLHVGYEPISMPRQMIDALTFMMGEVEGRETGITGHEVSAMLRNIKVLVPWIHEPTGQQLFMQAAATMYALLAPSTLSEGCFLAAIQSAAFHNVKIIRNKCEEVSIKYWMSEEDDRACIRPLLSAVIHVQRESDALMRALHNIGGKSSKRHFWREAHKCCIVVEHEVTKCNKIEEGTFNLATSFHALSEMCEHEENLSMSSNPRITPGELAVVQNATDLYLQERAPY